MLSHLLLARNKNKNHTATSRAVGTSQPTRRLRWRWHRDHAAHRGTSTRNIGSRNVCLYTGGASRRSCPACGQHLPSTSTTHLTVARCARPHRHPPYLGTLASARRLERPPGYRVAVRCRMFSAWGKAEGAARWCVPEGTLSGKDLARARAAHSEWVPARAGPYLYHSVARRSSHALSCRSAHCE